MDIIAAFTRPYLGEVYIKHKLRSAGADWPEIVHRLSGHGLIDTCCHFDIPTLVKLFAQIDAEQIRVVANRRHIKDYCCHSNCCDSATPAPFAGNRSSAHAV